MNDINDSAILDRFFERDESAIVKTAEKYGKILNGISLSITKNSYDAEECVNDTYLAAWNSIPPCRPDNFHAFLCRIVRNISFDVVDRRMAQKRSAEVIPFTDELNEIIDDGSPDADKDRLGSAIDGFLRRLDRSNCLIFVRRYFYSDSIADISRLSGVGEGAISARLFRMKKELRCYLEKEGFLI